MGRARGSCAGCLEVRVAKKKKKWVPPWTELRRPDGTLRGRYRIEGSQVVIQDLNGGTRSAELLNSDPEQLARHMFEVDDETMDR